MFDQVHEISILVAALLSIAVGSVWYSPFLFGPMWTRASGRRTAPESSPAALWAGAFRALLLQVFFFGVLAVFVEASLKGAFPLLTVGLLLSLLVILCIAYAVLWERYSPAYLWVHGGYAAVIIFGGIGIMAAWPW